MTDDVAFMEAAIEEAAKSNPEDGRPRPRVGAVIARDGKVLSKAYRNEDGKGSHAEFLALRKLEDLGDTAEDATVYTTLEPCVYRKSKNKIPCATRLVDAKVRRVVYGIIDPHRTVQSKGLLQLRRHQIAVESFPAEFGARIEELNSGFLQAYAGGEASHRFVADNRNRSLDDWYRTINRIYGRRNVGQAASEIFGHLIETAAGMSFLETGKEKPGANARQFTVKAIAWWFALCGRLRVRSVEQMIWAKFPGVCPYCMQCPHGSDCKSLNLIPDWTQLQLLGAQLRIPCNLREWQAMFKGIYPNTSLLPPGRIYAHFMEELGELAEAIRVFETAPGLFLAEAPDVLAWIFQIRNFLDGDCSEQAAVIGDKFCRAYPDFCVSCRAEVCECPAILPSTVGRLGGAIPPAVFGTGDDQRRAFMSADEVPDFFDF